VSFFFLAEVLAVMTAITFAIGDVVARLAVRQSTPYTGAVLATVTGLVVFLLIALGTFSWEDFNLPGTLWFLGAGIFHPGLGVIALYKAFERVGVARTVAILGMSPLISVAIAVLFIGERPGPIVILGTFLIVLGVVFISQEEAKGDRRLALLNLMWPVLTAVCFGAAPVLRKAGLLHFPSPVMGIVVSSIGGLAILVACVGFLPPGQRFSGNRLGAIQFTVCGLIYALAVYLYFVALGRGTVSIVVPLLFTYPLFVLIIVAVFLRKLERVTPRLVTGAVLTVAGAGIITGLG
jgi:drug/metabolite transporter (DMT)-like permease